MSITSVLLDFSQDGSLRVNTRVTYESKPPQPKTQRKVAAEVLRTALEAVEAGEVVDLGFSQSSKKQTHVSTWQVKESK